jgi:signal transduction histidine kinase
MAVRGLEGTRKLVVMASVAAIALSAGALVMIPSALRSITSSNFLPHATCYLYNKQLIALHVGSDTAIWLAYVAISCTLVYLVWKTRREIPFSWMFLAFGTFIVACGFTHFMEVVVLWKPLYWLAGDVKLVTALASVVTAIALPGLVPEARKMVLSAHVSEERREQLERANAELQQTSARILAVQDVERRRVARELHGSIGQYLAAIKMSCGAALETSRDERGTALLDDAVKLLDRCTSEVRTMSYLLHPPLLEEMGLASAMPWYVAGFTERSGVQVKLDLPTRLSRLPENVELALFRVLQESLTNIHRHSGSKQAAIQLRVEDGSVWLVVEDAGKGFGPAVGDALRAGVGIASMRERVRELGGELHVRSSASGTIVEAKLPLPREQAPRNGHKELKPRALA